MAGLVLHVLMISATMAVMEASPSLYKIDNIHSDPARNISQETSKDASDVQRVSPREERHDGDLALTDPPRSFISTAALVPNDDVRENMEKNMEKGHKNLQKHKTLGQLPSRRTNGTDGHESTAAQTPNSASEEKIWSPGRGTVQERSSFALQSTDDVGSEPARVGAMEALTTVHPVVSTVALTKTMLNVQTGDDGPYTPIQKLQIDSGGDLQNDIESQHESHNPRVALDARRGTNEDNLLEDNLTPNVEQPTESDRAAFMTTDGSSALLDPGAEGNEVISSDVEFLHYQKDGNAILEEPVRVDNETQDPYSLLQYKEALDDIGPARPTWSPLRDDLPHATADARDRVTLEAKARTETEKILVTGGAGRKEVTPVLPVSPQSHDILLTSQHAQETPTPAMQALPKSSDKSQESVGASTQPWKKTPETQRHPIIAPLDPGPGTPSQSGENATPKLFQNETKRNGRRGEIRVTTQRALRRPHLIDVPTSLPSKKTTLETPLCSKNSGTCEFVGTNQTHLKWEDLQRTLHFAWDMHVYGTGALFLLLAVIALINLIGAPILRVNHLPYVVVANVFLFVIGVLRGVFFLLDPYGTKSKISQPIALVLYNVTFPLMLSAFATLVLLVLKIAHLQLLPPKIQSLALLAVIAVIQFTVLLSADLLTHLLNPSVNMVLQIISISWGVFLMVGNFVVYYRLRKNSKDIVNETQRVSPTSEEIVVVQSQERSIKCIFTSSRVLLVSSIFGLLCCGLQVYAILWLYGLLGRKNEFSWPWWFLQFWFRIFELALCFSMVFVASHSFCLQCSSNDHTCWSKIISYFCTYKKSDAPEYPNNCYDWTNNIQDRMVNNNISKSLIRNQAENVPLRDIKENNETKSGPPFGNNSRTSSPLFKPKPESVFGPKSQNVTMGRSYTSICFEKESMLSLTDLEFRPPSPINLSRSIDEALFREHLVRDSIFLDSSLQYPTYLTRQDSCSSLKESSALNQTIDPLISSDLKMRRCSNPDYMYSLAKGCSMTEVDSTSESLQQSKELPRDATTEAVVSASSMDSVSKGSIKISWNPWRHGLSSVESLPLEDTPSAQLLKQGSQPSIVSKASEPEKALGRRLIERSQTTDSHSIGSETIEL